MTSLGAEGHMRGRRSCVSDNVRVGVVAEGLVSMGWMPEEEGGGSINTVIGWGGALMLSEVRPRVCPWGLGGGPLDLGASRPGRAPKAWGCPPLLQPPCFGGGGSQNP